MVIKKTFYAFYISSFLLLSSSCGSSVAQQITIDYQGDKVQVSDYKNDSIRISVDGAKVVVDSKMEGQKLNLRLTGQSEDGKLTLQKKGKAEIVLDGLKLTSQEGAPLCVKGKKSVKVVAKEGTENVLTIAACLDTAHQKAAVIWSKGSIHLDGKGKLDLLATGDGCKGVNSKKDVVISDLVLNVITSGNNLGKDTSMMFPGGDFGGPMPEFDFNNIPDSVKKFFDEMMKNMPPMGGQMPDFGNMPAPPTGGMPPMGGQMPDFGQMPPMGGGFPMGGGMPGFGGPMGPSGDPDETVKAEGFKQRYIGKTKAIKAAGEVIIQSGKVYCKTSSQGAEGIEGKKGVTVNGGEVTVDAVDDAINANGPIRFNGGVVIAESHCNDAIDANMEGGFPMFGMQQNTKPLEPAIVINGAKVYAWSHVGSPEEGMDCDFAPLGVSGGEIFSIGAGMGEMPSVPTQETAQQPTLLLVNLTLVKGENLQILEGKKVVYSVKVPFSFNGSASIVTCPSLKKGKSYTAKTKDYEKTFTLDDNFFVVR